MTLVFAGRLREARACLQRAMKDRPSQRPPRWFGMDKSHWWRAIRGGPKRLPAHIEINQDDECLAAWRHSQN